MRITPIHSLKIHPQFSQSNIKTESYFPEVKNNGKTLSTFQQFLEAGKVTLKIMTVPALLSLYIDWLLSESFFKRKQH